MKKSTIFALFCFFIGNAALPAKAEEPPAVVPETAEEIDKTEILSLEELQKISPWEIGKFLKSNDDFFSGEAAVSRLEPDDGGPTAAALAPKTRTCWHTHDNIQIILCTAGNGFYQAWGDRVLKIIPGDVIAVPADVKHWYGANKTSWLQTLSYFPNSKNSKTETDESVEDDYYSNIK